MNQFYEDLIKAVLQDVADDPEYYAKFMEDKNDGNSDNTESEKESA